MLMVDISHVEQLWDEYKIKATHNEKLIKEKELQHEKLLQKMFKLQKFEESLTDKVEDMNYKTDSQKAEIQHLEVMCSELEQDTETTKSFCESQTLILEQDLERKLQILQHLLDNNTYLETENKDYVHKIKESQSNMTLLEMEIQELQEEIAKDAKQKTYQQKEIKYFTKVLKESKIRMDETVDEILKDETEMKILSDSLKEQISEETKAGLQAEARISTLLAELKERKDAVRF
ncbi:uncharacterized protein LOC115085328 [Rhinatrema bivittatum]|uniref:uncharacterized protein LOC115085328 n=1 Tax=Rhinatrema bivittatum TaxID=194408 RepID=UPI00112C2647|nr:uncharacterized protein LOC115085328 [Rhinatrema bivittatum]